MQIEYDSAHPLYPVNYALNDINIYVYETRD